MTKVTTTYEYGRFTEQDAAGLQLRLPETEQPGETHGPYTALYVTGKSYLMLLPADYHPAFDPIKPQVVVGLDDVARVDVQR